MTLRKKRKMLSLPRSMWNVNVVCICIEMIDLDLDLDLDLDSVRWNFPSIFAPLIMFIHLWLLNPFSFELITNAIIWYSSLRNNSAITCQVFCLKWFFWLLKFILRLHLVILKCNLNREKIISLTPAHTSRISSQLSTSST